MSHIWLAQQKRGARAEFVSAVGSRIPTEHYERTIDRDTLIVPLTGVCFMNGFRSAVHEVVQLAHTSGALVMLNDYQDCGTRPVNVRTSEVDFYVTGTLKYLLGPPGLAFLYVRKELIESLEPTITGWFAQTNPFAFDVKKLDLAPSARRFEAGSPPVPNIYAAMKGIALLQEIGLENVSAHIATLARALLDGSQQLGVHAKTPADSLDRWWSCNAVTLRSWSKNWPPAESCVPAVTMGCAFPSTYITLWMMSRRYCGCWNKILTC
jgi:selenocysteine lyase/cysteine desulfurase